MKGCRPITPQEIARMLSKLDNPRDRAWITLQFVTALRISEVLSLKVKDVLQHGAIVDRLYVSRRNTKGKRSGRYIPLSDDGRKALREWIKESPHLQPSAYLFPSRQGQRLTYRRALQIFQDAAHKARIRGKIGTHTPRKTAAEAAWLGSDKDITIVQTILGHSCISSTLSYLPSVEAESEELLLNLYSQGNPFSKQPP